MRRHSAFLVFLFGEAVTLAALLLGGRASVTRFEKSSLPGGRALVSQLALTDLALGTEARYTRHPSQADHFAPFQDFPSAIEHYPAGSVVAPPAGWASPVALEDRRFVEIRSKRADRSHRDVSPFQGTASHQGAALQQRRDGPSQRGVLVSLAPR